MAKLHPGMFLCIVASIFICVPVAYAQKRDYVDRVEVFLDECDAPTTIYVVINDNDDVAKPARLEGDRWVWRAKPPLVLQLDPIPHASVRFGTGRTDCHRLTGWANDDNDPSKHVATFSFRRCERKNVRDVTLEKTVPPVKIGYHRVIAGTQGRDNVDCDEKATYFADRSRTFQAIWSPLESLRLQLNPDKTDPRALGMPVNFQIIQKYAKKKGDTLHLDRKRAARVLDYERQRGHGSAPQASPNAIDLDLRNFPNIESLDLTVSK
jgi:hypothetical protein